MNELLATEGFVLLRRPSASDGWQTFTLFSAEHGPLLALQRLLRKPSKTQFQLDLFDEAALSLETANQGRTWFVREARLIARHAGIGRSYEALQGASALAGLLARNPVSPESREGVAALWRTALAAFAAGVRPDIVYFKSVYRFARDEGYPVKQEWIPGLSPADREAALAMLNLPLSEQKATPEESARLQRHLDDYLRGSTEILTG